MRTFSICRARAVAVPAEDLDIGKARLFEQPEVEPDTDLADFSAMSPAIVIAMVHGQELIVSYPTTSTSLPVDFQNPSLDPPAIFDNAPPASQDIRLGQVLRRTTDGWRTDLALRASLAPRPCAAISTQTRLEPGAAKKTHAFRGRGACGMFHSQERHSPSVTHLLVQVDVYDSPVRGNRAGSLRTLTKFPAGR